jgi:hypothetical protein
MRQLLIIFALVLAPSLYAQQDDLVLFAQCVFIIQDETMLRSAESEIREHPNVKMVRLDQNTQRAFILTKDLQQLSEQELRSWFGEYSESVKCIQIGVYGLEKIDHYPFENCEQ